jgi:hypothetical protein
MKDTIETYENFTAEHAREICKGYAERKEKAMKETYEAFLNHVFSQIKNLAYGNSHIYNFHYLDQGFEKWDESFKELIVKELKIRGFNVEEETSKWNIFWLGHYLKISW